MLDQGAGRGIWGAMGMTRGAVLAWHTGLGGLAHGAGGPRTAMLRVFVAGPACELGKGKGADVSLIGQRGCASGERVACCA